jgi:CCR4-NOT transcription complex subunit 1 HEAT repeat
MHLFQARHFGMQELGALNSALQAAVDSDNRLFAIELAVAASRIDALSLGTWLSALFAENSTSAIRALTSFLSRKLEGQTGLRTFVPLERASLEQVAAV